MVRDIDQGSIFSGVGVSHDADNVQTRGEDELPNFDSLGEEEYKRIKFAELSREVLANEESSPLGLRLRKTPSFLKLVEKKLSEGSSMGRTESSQAISEKEKLKASNFSASVLRIGNWERVSRYEGDLVGKLYYAKRKLVWEVLNSGLKSKIEIQWSEIVGIRATFRPNQPDILEVELNHPPAYFQESNPQPRKHTLWHVTEDFTGGQAPVCRRHYLQCPEGTLEKHYEKLLQYDNRLFMLSRGPFPAIPTIYFPENLDGSNYDDFGDYANYNFQEHYRPEISPPVPRPGYPPSQYPDFDLSRSPSMLPPLAHGFKINYRDLNSPVSVVDYQGIDRRGTGNNDQHFQQQRPYSWGGGGQRMTVSMTNQGRQSAQERYGLDPSDHQYLRPPPQQNPSGFLIPTQSMAPSGHNHLALTQIEQHLLSDPTALLYAEEQGMLLDKVNSMGNLLNPYPNLNPNPPPYERIGGLGYVQTTPPPADAYIPRSSSVAMDSGQGYGSGGRFLGWQPLQETHENLVTQLGRIDRATNGVLTYNQNTNYANEGENYMWRQWR